MFQGADVGPAACEHAEAGVVAAAAQEYAFRSEQLAHGLDASLEAFYARLLDECAGQRLVWDRQQRKCCAEGSAMAAPSKFD